MKISGVTVGAKPPMSCSKRWHMLWDVGVIGCVMVVW